MYTQPVSESRSHGADWSDRLSSAAGDFASEILSLRLLDEAQRADFILNYRDESGGRRAIDLLVLQWLLDLTPELGATDNSFDSRVWRALCAKEDVLGLLSPSGPFTQTGDSIGIEVWTEVELRTLHAAWNSAIDRGSARTTSRCLAAARWHLENIQPDNATNIPWAIHLFAALADDGDASADIHAQTQLHAALTGRREPSRLTSLVLLDASEMHRLWRGD